MNDFGFRIRKLPQKFDLKSDPIQKWFKYAKNISHGYIS